MSNLLIRGNALRIPLADESVQCCVTSPPYWSLRDYGVEGQLGLEPTPDEFVANMVAVFREVKRVLREDGTCFVNLGDSYSGAGPQVTGYNEPDWIKTGGACNGGARVKVGMTGLTPKDLCGIPWRVALALQADGWYLRSDIIWAKPNPMPESVTDRPTKSHEYMFLLTKSERYYWDAEAVREPALPASEDRYQYSFGGMKNEAMREANINGIGCRVRIVGDRQPSGRNLRTVWTIPTESYPGAHFATYPRKLVEPCVKAGTSQKGCCPECGKGWVREVESPFKGDGNPNGYDKRLMIGNKMRMSGQQLAAWNEANPSKFVGWRPQCECRGKLVKRQTWVDFGAGRQYQTVWDYIPEGEQLAPVPCTVLDPFAGSGTTGVVAEGLHRRFIGIDLSREYLGMARNRIERPHKPIPRPGRVEHHPLFRDLEPPEAS